MENIVYILIGVTAAGLLIAFGWRLTSRRQALPCPVWLRWMVELDNPFTKTNRAAVIVEHLQLESDMRVADIGCGPGRLTIPLAKQVGPNGRVVAFDMQPGMLDRAREKARLAQLDNIDFLEAEIGTGQLPKNRFDRAVLVTVLGEVPDREAALREIFDAIKPGGILSVTEVIFDPHFQRRRTVTRLAEAVGFREQAFFGNRLAYTIHFEK